MDHKVSYLVIYAVTLVAMIVAAGTSYLKGLGYHPVENVGQSLSGTVYFCRPYEGTDVIDRGTVVAFHPPVRVEQMVHTVAPQAELALPWLKVVRAMDGDRVCWGQGTMIINGQIPHGMPLVQDYAFDIAAHCQTLGPDEVLVLGTNERSFDGRYFGVLHLAEVNETCLPHQ